MSQADTEDWDFADQALDRFDHFGNIRRISGSVRKENTVRMQRLDHIRACIPGNNGYVDASCIHRADDI